MKGVIFLLALMIGAWLIRQRWTRSGVLPRWSLLLAALGTALLSLLPGGGGLLPSGGREPGRLVIVDVSESMGVDLGGLLSRAHLQVGTSGRLVVVAAGEHPRVCWQGPAADYPDQLRPGVLPLDPLMRSNARLRQALMAGLACFTVNDALSVEIITDGGFVPFSFPLSAGEPAPRLVDWKVRKPSWPQSTNLALRIEGGPRVFRPGVSLNIAVSLKGWLRVPATIRLSSQVDDGAADWQTLSLPAGKVDRELILSTGALGPGSRSFRAAIRDVPGDARQGDNQDELPLVLQSDRPLMVVTGPADFVRQLSAAASSFAVSDDLRRIPAADLVVVSDRPWKGSPQDRDFLRALREAVAAGTGLLLAGDQRAFGPGQWQDSPMDELSPLKSRPGRGRVLLALALDASGSMEQAGRFRRAAAVALATFEGLGVKDRLALVLFADDVRFQIFERQDPDAATELARTLDSARPGGGTRLDRVLDTLVDLAPRPGERTLAFLLTDGQDPRALKPDRLDAWHRALKERHIDLRLFWFDHQEGLRPLLRRLVERDRDLVEVRDFATLQRPFLKVLREEYLVRNVQVRLQQGGESLRLSTLVRTRPDPGAEVLASAGEGLAALARMPRGLGLVAACPSDLMRAAREGLFGKAGLEGFLNSLVPTRKRLTGSLSLVSRDGDWVFRLQEWRGDGGRPVVMLKTGATPLTQVGLESWESAPVKELPADGLLEVRTAGGRTLLPWRGPGFQDCGPGPADEAIRLLGQWQPEDVSSSHSGDTPGQALLLLALSFFAADLALRACRR